MKIMASEISRRLTAHVIQGGWLGVSWSRYIVPEGATLSQLNAGWDLAVAMAARVGICFESEAQANFEAASRD